MAKDIEVHIYPHTGVDELEEEKIEAELNYEHYKVPSRSSEFGALVTWSCICHTQISHMLYMCGQTPRRMLAEIISHSE